MTHLRQSKPHFEVLDGLRGVAAIWVVLFHILEVHSGGDHVKQWLNHGYLGVDFFFMLSGFVVAYSYDDRWRAMGLGGFFRRRLIRLQPMIIIGSILGAVLFYFQHSPGLGWAGIPDVPVWKLLLVMLIGCALIPVGKSLDIRGWNEMYPLNGPAWTLFLEYIANIAYALVLRRFNTLVLWAAVVLAAGVTTHYALTNPNGDLIGGWSVTDPVHLRIGLTRLAFPFLAGMLLARLGWSIRTRSPFWLAGVVLVAALSVPHLGGDNHFNNRVYECLCLMVVFPCIILLGAGGNTDERQTSGICKWMGDISYPIYITHYPVVFLYYAFVVNQQKSLGESWPQALAALLTALALAWACMKWYDLPLRAYLRKRFL